MGKTNVCIQSDNKELREAAEYLFGASGYFDLRNDDQRAEDESGMAVIDIDVADALNMGFSEFLSLTLEHLGVARQEKSSFSEGRIRTIAIASLSEDCASSRVAISLGNILFERGYRPAYLSLKPLNEMMQGCRMNELGFGRWLMDSRSKLMGPAEKYVYDDGEMVYIGAPVLNINAGDVGLEDIESVKDVLCSIDVDSLIIDIGTALDLERKKVFLASLCPVLILDGSELCEKLFHKYFEGAIPLLSKEITDEELSGIVGVIEGNIGEEDEEYSVWNWEYGICRGACKGSICDDCGKRDIKRQEGKGVNR